MESVPSLPPGWYPSYDTCPEVSPWCPVEATTLGYAPIKSLHIFLAAAYGVLGAVTLGLGILYQTWEFSLAVAVGCFLELIGYVGRARMGINPWDYDAFRMQIVAIILGPTLVCIGLYLTLRHIVIHLNRDLSRVRPRIYPTFFIPADISCLVIQGVGGGIAAAAETRSLLKHGNNLIMAGISLQVAVLAFFGIAAFDYLWRARRFFTSFPSIPSSDPATNEKHRAGALLWTNRKFRVWLIVLSIAYAALMVRCIYRIAEMAGGWGNEIMQDEPSFIVLESFMVLVACILLTMFPPGYFFPQMGRRWRRGGGRESTGSEREGESAMGSGSATEVEVEGMGEKV